MIETHWHYTQYDAHTRFTCPCANVVQSLCFSVTQCVSQAVHHANHYTTLMKHMYVYVNVLNVFVNVANVLVDVIEGFRSMLSPYSLRCTIRPDPATCYRCYATLIAPDLGY